MFLFTGDSYIPNTRQQYQFPKGNKNNIINQKRESKNMR